MADKKISALTGASTPLAGTEVLPIVQSGATVKVAVSDLTAGRTTALGNNSTVGTSSVFPFITANGARVGNDANSPTRVTVGNQNAGASAVSGIGFESAGGGWQIDVPPDVSTFVNPLIGKFNGAERFRWDATGNYVPSVAAKGINFTANTPAAGMTSQLLNWYEEGTFTATLTATTTGPTTPITATANYVRIGKTVTVCVSFLNVDTTGASGTTKITGLPFTPSAIAQLSTTSNIASTPTIAQIGTGQPWMELTSIQTAAGAAITAGAGRYLFISGTYFV